MKHVVAQAHLTALLTALVAALAATPVHAAGPHWLNDRDLHFVFAGREFAGTYANGAPFTEVYRKSGRIEYRDSTQQLEGTWSIKSGNFCTTYASGSGGCFRVTRLSENCFELWFMNDKNDSLDPAWMARSWQAKHPSTCTR